MADFSTYVKSVYIDSCTRLVTLTMNGIAADDDTITFPVGTVWQSEITSSGNFGHVGNVLTLTDITDNDIVIMLLPDNGPYNIEYYNYVLEEIYYEPIYCDCDKVTVCDCNDNGGCSCSSIRNDDKNIVSKNIYGVLSKDNYLDSDFSREYALEMKYDESVREIILNDNRVDYTGDTDSTEVLTDNYVKKVLLTYLNYDKFNAKFIEQIVHSELTDSSTHEWRMPLGSFNCYYHNEEGCVSAEPDFTHATVFVEYLTGNGSFVVTRDVYPVRYTKQLNIEDGKPKLDGLYKSYFFLIPKFIETIQNATGNSVVVSHSEFMNIVNSDGENIVLMFSNSVIKLISPNVYLVENSLSGSILIYNLSIPEELENLISAYSIESDLDMLKNISSVDNDLHIAPYNPMRTIYAEDAHLVTYETRDMIVESIMDCEIPCEKFSFDEWMALSQKKKAARIHFCNENFTETARIMFTLEERCKNC